MVSTMNHGKSIYQHVMLAACVTLCLLAISPVVSATPNVLLVLADDLGVECLSTYGGTSHRTPHLDRLAKEGMRFTRCFSNPYCSPSRGTLLTGRYPFQNGLTVVLHSKNQEDIYLRPSQPSFVRQLKHHGYATQLVGKWHVSLEHKHNTIREFGFDHYQTWQIFDSQGEKTTRYWNPHLLRDGRLVADQIQSRYGPDVDLEVYLDFIKASAENKTPFLAYYATCLPHFPWEPTPDSKEQTYRAPHAGHKGDPKYFHSLRRSQDGHQCQVGNRTTGTSSRSSLEGGRRNLLTPRSRSSRGSWISSSDRSGQ